MGFRSCRWLPSNNSAPNTKILNEIRRSTIKNVERIFLRTSNTHLDVQNDGASPSSSSGHMQLGEEAVGSVFISGCCSNRSPETHYNNNSRRRTGEEGEDATRH